MCARYRQRPERSIVLDEQTIILDLHISILNSSHPEQKNGNYYSKHSNNNKLTKKAYTTVKLQIAVAGITKLGVIICEIIERLQ